MKVFLLVEDYTVYYEQKLHITPFEKYEDAKFQFDQSVGSDIADHPDTVRSHTETHYENFEHGEFAEEHSVIYILEKEVK